jgi:hypothetical protein
LTPQRSASFDRARPRAFARRTIALALGSSCCCAVSVRAGAGRATLGPAVVARVVVG